MKDLRLRCNGLTKNIIFWGGTGQSVVNREILRLFSSNLLAIFDDTPEIKSPFQMLLFSMAARLMGGSLNRLKGQKSDS
ncbi:MAG: hypothetical protein IPL83_11010 [Bdellovibrionales bacterium]|nr:hypothetical protein [Bdellovibrionales bacterium]